MSAKYEFIDAEKAQLRDREDVSTGGSFHVGLLRVARPAGLGNRPTPSAVGGPIRVDLRRLGSDLRASPGPRGPGPSGRVAAARSWCAGSCASWAWSRASRGRGGPRPPSAATPGRSPTFSAVTSRASAGHQARRRHHLHPDLGGLALPRHGDRLPHEVPASATPWPTTCAPTWSLMRYRWRPATTRWPTSAIFHSDRGTQYTCEAFAVAAGEHRIRRSVGRTGVCFDNAQAESFNAALKVERVNRTVYPTREHARADVARYIEFRYNTKRLHSALGYRTPQEVHDEHLNQQSAA